MKKNMRRLVGLAGLLFCSYPAANAIDKPIVIGNSRVTFITDNLVRLEYANDAKFLNDSTLFAVDRSARDVDVKMERNGRKYIFTTKAMRLELDADGCPFGQNNVKATWQQGASKEDGA